MKKKSLADVSGWSPVQDVGARVPSTPQWFRNKPLTKCRPNAKYMEMGGRGEGVIQRPNFPNGKATGKGTGRGERAADISRLSRLKMVPGENSKS